MAKKDDVIKLRMLLGADEDEPALPIEFALDNAADIIKNYCNISEVPHGLETTLYRMAMDLYRYEQMGSGGEDVPQGVTSISVGDTSTSFGEVTSTEYKSSILKNYESTLRRFRKVVF